MLKEIEGGGILVGGRDGMGADCAAPQGIVATGTATNGNNPNGASANRQPTNGSSAYRNNNADGGSSKRKETDREAAKSEEAAGQSSKREPAGGDITEREDAAGMSADLSALPIGTDGNGPERQTAEFARGAHHRGLVLRLNRKVYRVGRARCLRPYRTLCCPAS